MTNVGAFNARIDLYSRNTQLGVDDVVFSVSPAQSSSDSRAQKLLAAMLTEIASQSYHEDQGTDDVANMPSRGRICLGQKKQVQE